MEVNQTNLISARRGLQVVFDKAYQGITDLWWKILVLMSTSKGAEEEYHWLGAVPGLKEMLGEIVIQNLLNHNYTIRNREFEDTIGIKRRDIERDSLGIYNPLVSAMAEAAAVHPGELVASLLVNGFSAKDYTGSAFFAANKKAHAKAKPFSNVGTKKLSADNFSAGRANLIGRLNAQGRPMRLGKKLQLVVSPTYETLAKTILTAEKLNDNTNLLRGTAEPLVLPELLALNAEHAWFILEAGNPMKPFIVQIEKEPSTAMVTDPNDSHVVKHGEFLYQVYARHNAGYGLPELAYGSDGTQAA